METKEWVRHVDGNTFESAVLKTDGRSIRILDREALGELEEGD